VGEGRVATHSPRRPAHRGAHTAQQGKQPRLVRAIMVVGGRCDPFIFILGLKWWQLSHDPGF
jgi:hypothetical protein